MNRKKILIPLLIIFILLINVLVSTVYKGFMSFAVDTQGESNVRVSVDDTDLNNIKITMGGNFDSNIVSIKYTDGGRVSKDEVIDYFNNSSNHIIDITNKNQGASSNILAVTIENAIQGKEYTILVVFEDGTAHIGYATIGERTNGSMNIGYNYDKQVLTINVESNPNNIVLLKVAKSSDISQISDFDTKGEVISITPSTNVTTTYEIKEEGIYKLYAKDSAGYSNMIETKYLALPSEKTIKIVHKKGDNNALVIKAEDSAHKITEMKIMLSNSEVSLDNIANNGTPISISAGTKVQGEYNISGDNTYVTVYVKDEYGATDIYGKTINSIEEDNTIVVPVDPDDESENQGTGTEGSGNQGTGTEGSENQGTGTEGSENQGTGTEGSGNQETGTEGSENQGTGTEGSENQGTGTEGSGNQGTGTEGLENQGTGTEGSENQGTGTEGSGNQGTGTEGSGNQGAGNEGNIVVPMPDDSNNGTSGDGNEIGEVNPEDNNTNTNLNIEDHSNINSTNNQTNIQDNEQINSSNNESLPKTGVEDTGIILLIVTLLGVAVISFVKFIRIK